MFIRTRKSIRSKPSKISILRGALNFEGRQISYITIFVAVDPHNKKGSTQYSSKVEI